ncbi:MAG: orotate phosphoribosyltransferase [Oscillospiraceae bacterium]
MSYKEEFIEFMVLSNVLTFGDFTTKSGRKTPYFINTGNYKTGAQASKLGQYYAQCFQEHFANSQVKALFGPAYKGIPLSVACAISLYNNFSQDVNYCFNRKEEKDHGEGGSLVGYKLCDGDKVVIIEDVITAGTAMRECLPILKGIADVEIVGLIVSADRMEKGTGSLSAIQEIKRDYDIDTFPIVTVREIIDTLHNRKVDGKIFVDDRMRENMEKYLDEYGIK